MEHIGGKGKSKAPGMRPISMRVSLGDLRRALRDVSNFTDAVQVIVKRNEDGTIMVKRPESHA